ncbi:tRNA preQ1(34) S-adenosylmethionine ribosyltransferase-isomerase QueA [Pikeienuella piscinae]|uniref:S-adenosylmethionine:tRNA ribosyltransferase-isomerase n=1 Tax=Pikeienuella piscinae TaxID=2748098 RepID=A0A7L5BU65_9RHOB|nr:tRNA preQ1(34) S-adenosylmethionine ribosyltransferase-isomerase QueA [Pikeienuella piscinae]QIE54483.1 tRNA preQ1(34) S-adenosylmethionine ribosyltransferase-isomerase QueA [Pikeienuella piscinae]
MRVDEFDFDLPEELIALRPARPRRAAKMLVASAATDEITVFEDLPRHLKRGDLIVFNDTKVIPARLTGRRIRAQSEVAMEATLLKRLGPDRWSALAKPGKRLRPGDALDFNGLRATLAAKDEGGLVEIAFAEKGALLDAAIARVGAPPLPPYIAARRAADAEDVADYQTIFAERPGAVAAPTASLHFEPEVMAALEAAGVATARLTLHVGAGTFLPVKAEEAADHHMHAEWGEITPEAATMINAARRAGGRIIAAGTTALRLLESAAEPDGRIAPWRGETDIFILPGHRFLAVDGLITNFHLPRSTLFMLVSAFMGTARMRALYTQAIAARMRFYSYGDASLLWRPLTRDCIPA